VNAENYVDNSDISESDEKNFKFPYEYYNTKNIYYNVGYWNEEYYRLGIVYIFEDGSLSPTYNILGYETVNGSNPKYNGVIDENNTDRCQNVDELFNFDNIDIKNILYDEDGFIDSRQLDFLNISSNPEKYFVENTINSKGVIRINDDEIRTYSDKEPGNYLYNIGVYIN
jgi:hypothetical protein